MRSLLSPVLVAGVLFLVWASPALAAGEREKAFEVGQRACSMLMKTLKGELKATMAEGGPAAAVHVCSGKAQALTAQVARDAAVKDLTLKRTALGIRNPQNAPDPEEREALEAYQASLDKGEALEAKLEDRGDSYRFVTPILMGNLCMVCHGDPDRISGRVREIIRERYPNDEAVGFVPGQLRGMFSVTIPKKSISAMPDTPGPS